MNFKLRKININDICFDDKCKVVGDCLHINPKVLEDLVLSDSKVKKVSFDIARPGESVRIVPVKDIIEPRAKLDGSESFPGSFKEDMKIAGEGVTYALSGCAVTSTGPIVGFQEGVIDMSGPGAKYTEYSKLNHVVMIIEKQDNVDQHDHEVVVRLAGLRVAQYLATLGFEHEDYVSEEYEWNSISEKAGEFPDLPKVAYVYNIMSQGLLHDTYFYGRDSKLMTPTIISPLEVIDGAVVSGNCVSPGSKTTTYMHQNNAVITELFNQHGKELNFMGVVLNPLMTTLKEKYRNRMLSVQAVKSIGADGAIISQEGFGNPTTDLMIVCKELEDNEIKTVIITNEDAGLDGMSEPLPDSVPEANAIVSTGNSNATVMLPPVEKTIGILSEIERVCGGNVDSIQPDGSLLLEIHGIMGSHNLQGNTLLGSVTY